MPFSPNHLAELNLLLQFPSISTQEGIKVHAHSAAPETVRAAESLFAKGLISQKDGGYLTPLGCEARVYSETAIDVDERLTVMVG